MPVDPYRTLFGKGDPTDASVTDWAEHGRAGGLSTGQPFKFTSSHDSSYGKQSDEGVNTETDITGSLWSTDTWTGAGEQNQFNQVAVSLTTDEAGMLYFDFSVDGSNWSAFPVAGFTVASGIHEFHTAVKLGRYFRPRFVGEGGRSYFRLFSYYGNDFLPTNAPLNQSISADQDAVINRSVLVGRAQGGSYLNVPVSSQGLLQTDLPLTAFGEISIAEKTPQVQVKFPAGLNEAIIQKLTNKAGSTVTASDGLCTITCAATAESFSQIRTLDVIRYGTGQGMDAKFTAGFTTGVANSTQWAGPGDDDEMLGFGYNGTSFGILHRKMGELEVRSLTITAGESTGAGDITITLDGTAVTVAIEVGDSIADVVAKIVAESANIFNAGRGWEVHTEDSKTATFISLVSENASGTFSFADTDSTGVAAGTFNQATTKLAGVAPSENIIPQASWNIDVCDGTGVSGMTIDPTKLNVFDVNFQYLGAGNLFFSVENPATGRLEPVHMMKHAGSQTTPTFRNPTFHINFIAKTESGYSGGALSMITASIAGFIEGKEGNIGVRRNVSASVVTNGTTEVVNLVLANEEVFNGTRNKIEVYPDHLTLINASTRNVIVDIYKQPTHLNSGVTLASAGSGSVMEFGAGTGTRQGGDLLLTVAVSASASKDLEIGHLGMKLRPTETLAFVATKGSGGQDGIMTVGVSWIERG